MAAGPFMPILLRRPLGLLLAMLILAAGAFLCRVWLAVGDGMTRLDDPGHRPWLIVFERYRTGPGSTLPRDLVQDLQRTPGVSAAIPEVHATTVATGPAEALRIRGIDPRDLLALGAVSARADGTIREWLTRARQGAAPPTTTSPEVHAAAVIGRRLARRMARNKGDVLQIALASGTTVWAEIVEISDVGPAENESTLFVEPEALPGSHGPLPGGTCTAIRVLPDAGVDEAGLALTIERAFARYAPPVRAFTGDGWMRHELADGRGLLRLWRVMAVIAFLASLAGWALALGVSLAPRVPDIAVLQLVGSNAQALSQRISIVSLLAGAVAGAAGAMLAARLIARDMPVLVSGSVVIELPLLIESTLLVAGLTALGAAGASWWPSRRVNRAAAKRVLNM